VSNNLITLSIILPTINEEKNLEKLIPEIITELEGSSIEEYEILVVDDGSTDNTFSFVNSLRESNESIQIIIRNDEPSLPMSIYDGIRKSKYDYVMWLDADGSMPAKTIRELVNKQALNLNSVIIGSRFVTGGGYKGIQDIGETSFLDAVKNVRKSNDSVFGMVASTLFNKLLIFLLSSKVKDLTSGFIIGKKDNFKKEIFSISSYGEYFVYLVSDLVQNKKDIIELGYVCETRIHGQSKTASSILQLINRGIPYIRAAIICRRKQ
tara:strand:+ start:39148 stop:39945 length:798 start_codon:yes stop_codon:yes gene_type:complete